MRFDGREDGRDGRDDGSDRPEGRRGGRRASTRVILSVRVRADFDRQVFPVIFFLPLPSEYGALKQLRSDYDQNSARLDYG